MVFVVVESICQKIVEQSSAMDDDLHLGVRPSAARQINRVFRPGFRISTVNDDELDEDIAHVEIDLLGSTGFIPAQLAT